MKFHHAQQGKHPCLVVFLKGLSREENSCTKAPFSAPSRMITRNLAVHRVEDINILIVFHLFIILIRMWSILDFCLFVFLFFLQANYLTTAYWQISKVQKLIFALSPSKHSEAVSKPIAPMQLSYGAGTRKVRVRTRAGRLQPAHGNGALGSTGLHPAPHECSSSHRLFLWLGDDSVLYWPGRPDSWVKPLKRNNMKYSLLSA